MREIKAPNTIHIINNETSLFLAGSIEMGSAEDWQHKVTNALSDIEHLVIFNPRRDDWDSSWLQDINNTPFRNQVMWELDALARADKIFMFFSPGTRSPISLLELGLFIAKDIYVCCPEGFWRKGNVDIVCSVYCERPVFANLDLAIHECRADIVRD